MSSWDPLTGGSPGRQARARRRDPVTTRPRAWRAESARALYCWAPKLQLLCVLLTGVSAGPRVWQGVSQQARRKGGAPRRRRASRCGLLHRQAPRRRPRRAVPGRRGSVVARCGREEGSSMTGPSCRQTRPLRRARLLQRRRQRRRALHHRHSRTCSRLRPAPRCGRTQCTRREAEAVRRSPQDRLPATRHRGRRAASPQPRPRSVPRPKVRPRRSTLSPVRRPSRTPSPRPKPADRPCRRGCTAECSSNRRRP